MIIRLSKKEVPFHNGTSRKVYKKPKFLLFVLENDSTKTVPNMQTAGNQHIRKIRGKPACLIIRQRCMIIRQ